MQNSESLYQVTQSSSKLVKYRFNLYDKYKVKRSPELTRTSEMRRKRFPGNSRDHLPYLSRFFSYRLASKLLHIYIHRRDRKCFQYCEIPRMKSKVHYSYWKKSINWALKEIDVLINKQTYSN